MYGELLYPVLHVSKLHDYCITHVMCNLIQLTVVQIRTCMSAASTSSLEKEVDFMVQWHATINAVKF